MVKVKVKVGDAGVGLVRGVCVGEDKVKGVGGYEGQIRNDSSEETRRQISCIDRLFFI